MNLIEYSIFGNAISNAEEQQNPNSGEQYATFRFASKDITGTPQYYQVNVYGKRAASIIKYVKKGKPLYIRGPVKIKAGDKKTFTDIYPDRVLFLGQPPKKQPVDTLRETAETIRKTTPKAK